MEGGLVWLRARAPDSDPERVITWGRIEREADGRLVADCRSERSPAMEPNLQLGEIPLADLDALVQHPHWGIETALPI